MPIPTRIAKCLLHAALLTTLALATPTRADDCEEQWLTDLGVYGIYRDVYTTALWDPDGPGPSAAQLVVGGDIYISDGSPFSVDRGVARWDGVQWQKFPQGLRGPLAPTQGATVHAIAVLDIGTLVIGGTFFGVTPGSQTLSGGAYWDGTHWRPFGRASGEPDLGPRKMTVLDDGTLIASGRLYPQVGNPFALARWNGSDWEPLITVLSPFTPIETLAAQDNDLLIGGRFSNLILPGSEDILRWTGPYPGTWSAFPPPGEVGASTQVNAITTLPNGDIIAGGRLSADGTHLVARWDGSTWTPMNAGLEGVQEIGALYTRPDGTVFAGTRHRSPAAPIAGRLLKWNGAAWETMATLQEGRSVRTLGPSPDGGVVAGGDFYTITQNGRTFNTRGIARLGAPIPVIDPFPIPAVPCPRGTATFTVDIREPNNDTFQWQLRDAAAPNGWRTLTDGADNGLTFTGTTTAQLSITPDAMYRADTLPEVRVVVTNPCGTTTSRSATVQPCPADWDCSGGIDGDDIAAFFTDWQQGNGDADMSGATDGNDITVFFDRWQRGECFPRW